MKGKKIASLSSEDINKEVKIVGNLYYESKKTKDGSNYIAGSLADNTSKIFFSLFPGDNALDEVLKVTSGTLISCYVMLSSVTEGKNKMLKKAGSLREIIIVSENDTFDKKKVKATLMKGFLKIEDDDIKKIVQNCLNLDYDGTIINNNRRSKPFFEVPAFVNRYNYAGGLSKFTADMLDKYLLLSEVMLDANHYRYESSSVPFKQDIVLATIFLQDIGAINAFKLDKNDLIKESFSSHLNSTDSISKKILEKELSKIEMDSAKRELLYHAVVSCSKNFTKWDYNESAKTFEAKFCHQLREMVLLEETYLSICDKMEQGNEFLKDSENYPWFIPAFINE
ncbi:MAG: hypothetical protein RSC93_07780 [Erysipelotrichaceae bacterium]